MKKNRRNNTHLENSKGISKHEFKLGSQAAPYVVREQFNDYDYLDKLSPEDLAWLAEFTSNESTGFDVDADIVGEEAADNMNSLENKRKAYRRKNFKQNNCPFTTRYQKSMEDKVYSESATTLHEVFTDDQYLSDIEQADRNIDIFWADKNKN